MSGKLSTKNITTGGDGVSKTLEPGVALCKINGLSLEEFKFKDGAYNVILHLEGEDLGSGFEGFFIDKDRPELGKHKGKVGNVKGTEWAFADGETKSGVQVSRDMEMLKWLKQFCSSIGCLAWFDSQDEKHDTIESLFAAFSKDKPFKDNFYAFCIAGKEYTNRGGYTAHDLFLPRYSKEGVPVELDNASPSKLLKFKPEDHIKKRKVEPVNEFGGDTSTPGISTDGADFDL
jgi:hypothetical protein